MRHQRMITLSRAFISTECLFWHVSVVFNLLHPGGLRCVRMLHWNITCVAVSESACMTLPPKSTLVKLSVCRWVLEPRMDGAMVSVSSFSKNWPMNGQACWITLKNRQEEKECVIFYIRTCRFFFLLNFRLFMFMEYFFRNILAWTFI